MYRKRTTVSMRCRMKLIKTIFILSTLLLVISACTVLVWAFVPKLSKRFPNGTKVGGVLCAVGALAVGITLAAFFRMFFHSKQSAARVIVVADNSGYFHRKYSMTKCNHKFHHNVLHRSFSSAYVPVTSSIVGEKGAVQVFGLLSGGDYTLSAMELNSSHTPNTTGLEIGNATSTKTAAPVGETGLSKVQSEVLVPVVVRHSAISSKTKPLRRSLSRMKYCQSDSNQVAKTVGTSKNEEAFSTIGFLQKTFSDGFLLPTDKSTKPLRAPTDGADPKVLAKLSLINFADLPTLAPPDKSAGQHLSLLNRQNHGDIFRHLQSQVISCATLFDEPVSDSEEVDVEKSPRTTVLCRQLQPTTSPCADVFPVVQSDVAKQSASQCGKPTFQRSLASRLKEFACRLLRIDGKAVASEQEVDDQSTMPTCGRQADRTDLLGNMETDSTSGTPTKPTIVSNASVFSLPAISSAMWTVDRPVWIMGLTDVIVLGRSDNQVGTQQPLTHTGSSSSVFAFHVHPPPRLKARRTDSQVVDEERRGVSRRTRSLGRILFSGEKHTLIPHSDESKGEIY